MPVFIIPKATPYGQPQRVCPACDSQGTWVHQWVRRALSETQGRKPSNNTVERVIGLGFKIRAKLMWGFKREENLVRFIHLGGWV